MKPTQAYVVAIAIAFSTLRDCNGEFVRCLFSNAGGCTGQSCRAHRVDRGCNQVERDFCTRECYNTAYSLGVFVMGHVFLTAMPPEGDRSNCPQILADARHYNAEGEYEPKKYASVLEDGYLSDMLQQQNFRIGSFPLRELLNASMRSAVVNPDDSSYNILSNNCATLVLSLMQALILEPTDELLDYVVDALMDSDSVMESQTFDDQSRFRNTNNRHLRVLQKTPGGRKAVKKAVRHNVRQFYPGSEW